MKIRPLSFNNIPPRLNQSWNEILLLILLLVGTLHTSCDDELADANTQDPINFPVAGFTVSNNLPSIGEAITLTDTSTAVASVIVAWAWDFGDGKTATEQSPSHNYEEDDYYAVTLVVTDDQGRKDETSQVIRVKDPSNPSQAPVAKIGGNLFVQIGKEVAFKDLSTDDGLIQEWSWDFGDGSTSTEKNPVHTYATMGEYIVKLTTADEEGFGSEETQATVQIWGEEWTFQAGDDIRDSSPAIADDGTMYIGSYDDHLHAINSDGTLKWSFATTNNIKAQPTIGVDGTIYIGSSDGIFYAINPEDGSQKWSFTTGDVIEHTAGALSDDGSVIFFGSKDDKVYGLNTSDGSLKWEYATGGDVLALPVVLSDGTVCVSSLDGKVYALDPDNGSEVWSTDVGGEVYGGSAIGLDGTIYVGVNAAGGNVVALNTDGTVKWIAAGEAGVTTSGPVIGPDGTIYICQKHATDRLLAISETDGSILWKFSDPSGTNTSNISTPTIDANGTIYFGSYEGSDFGLFGVNSDGSEKFRFYTNGDDGDVNSSVSIGPEGLIYFGSHNWNFYALQVYSDGLADSAWPMMGGNSKHTGNNN